VFRRFAILVSLMLVVSVGLLAEKAPLNLALVWHQHQPMYWNRLTDEYPEVQMTFNLPPSLLWQLEGYATITPEETARGGLHEHIGATDNHLQWTWTLATNPKALSGEDREAAADQSLWLNGYMFDDDANDPYCDPYYAELNTKADERIRTPMQWEPWGEVGFTTGTPWQPLAEDAHFRTVFAQTWNADSLLSRYRRLIALRAAEPALTRGDVMWIEMRNASIASYARRQGNQILWIVHNLAGSPAQSSAPSPIGAIEPGAYLATELLTRSTFSLVLGADGTIDDGLPEAPPFGTWILELSGASV